jgi:hypothetical protein
MVRADSAVLGGPRYIGLPADLMQRPVPWVDRDVPLSAMRVEVQVVALQPGELAPPGTGPGCGDDQRGGPVAHQPSGLQRDEKGLFRRGPGDLAAAVVLASPATLGADGVGRDEAFGGGVGQHHRHGFDDGGDGR